MLYYSAGATMVTRGPTRVRVAAGGRTAGDSDVTVQTPEMPSALTVFEPESSAIWPDATVFTFGSAATVEIERV